MLNAADGSGRRSLLSDLRLLVAAALLPLLGLIAWMEYDRLRHDVDEAGRLVVRLARFTASDTARFLSIATYLLDAAARHPGVAGAGPPDCDAAFVAFAALGPAYGGYVSTDASGRVRCSGDLPGLRRLPGGAHYPLPPEDHRTGVWIGASQPDPVSGWVVPIMQPLQTGGGHAGVRLLPDRFGIVVTTARLPEGAVAGIIDSAGRVLVHTAESPALHRGVSLDWVGAALGERDEGAQRHAGVDGAEYLFGYARVPETGWIAFAALPSAFAEAAGYRSMRNSLLATMGALALAVALATLFGRRLLRPARLAARAARKAAEGDLAVRLPESGPAEMAKVAVQFNRLLESLARDRQTRIGEAARLRDLLGLSADWYWEQDAEHRFIRVEGAAYDVAPVYKQVIGKRRWELPGYAPMEGGWEDHLACLERREAFYDTVFRQTTPSGETRYLRANGVPTYDASGNFAGYHGMAADITQEMARRLALEASERRYRELFEESHLSNLLIDPASGRIAEASGEGCALLGLSRAVLEHSRIDDIGLRARAGDSGVLAGLLDAHSVVELDFRGPDGRLRRLVAHTGPLATDGRNWLFVNLRDETARLEAQAELRKLSRAVEQSPAAILITDAEGRIEYANAGFLAVTGYAREEVLGRNPRMLQSGETPKETYAELWRTLKSGGVWRGELCNRTKAGALFWEYAVISAVTGEAGCVTHFVAVKENITARKQREEEILQLNAELDRRVAERTAELERANRELDAFSYSVSHDLRAPLRAINGFVHMVEESEAGRLGSEAAENLARVKRNAVRMGELIDEMLRFARIGRSEPKREKVSLRETALDVVRELAPAYPAAEARVGDLPDAICDRALMRQVFVNLIGNAFKYSARQAAPCIEIGTCGTA